MIIPTNFQIDIHGKHAQEMSQINDATHRLNYVVEMTEKAANRTMDLVELSAPLVNGLSDEAQQLREEWGRFMRREINADGFRDRRRSRREIHREMQAQGVMAGQQLGEMALERRRIDARVDFQQQRPRRRLRIAALGLEKAALSGQR